MPEAAELQEPGVEDLQAQVKELKNNLTAVWNYIYELRSAVSHHLTHLRQHQVELETSVHRMEHFHESDVQSSNMHHHSSEQHSHSGEHHSHGDEHSHGSDHSHGSMEGHSHSGEHHSHSDDHHSHGDDHHHSDEHGHHSHSYSHSHSSHDHSKEDSHSHGGHDDHHGHDHKDSHETEDLQQTQKVEPVVEPIIQATTRQDHSHHHHHQSFNSDSMNLLNEHSHHHHHDHSHDSRSSIRNKTVVLPKYSEYGLYDLALCRVQPNSALPDDQKQNVFGTITMWQKKTGGPLNFHVRLQGFDVGDHAHHQQTIQTEEDNETPQTVHHTHGFHVHSFGDVSSGCQATGPHYNPKGVNHGKPGPDALSRHVGDLGNIQCDQHGITNIVFSDDVASLTGQYSIIGKSIAVHAQEDDLGLGGDAESLKTGNAGPRLACCEIQSVDKIPIRQYKYMKTASQRNN